jgi:putative glycosyltransferase (TIGR04372 family)
MANTLTEKGFKVIRMGSLVEKPFYNGNKNIIDYASLKNKNDFYDIFLFANCEFVISTCVGLDELALLFRKPLVNCVVPIIGFKTYSKNILNFSKHHFSKKLNRNLKLSEMSSFYKDKNQNVHLAENFLKNGIIYKDNSPEEWRLIALEMIERINNRPINNDDIIQKRFWNNFKEVHKKISSANLNEEAKRDVKEFIINKELISKISVAFIEKNKEWMD